MTDCAPDALRADCAACTGWCCAAAAFDADQGFGYDKPAHEPCRHLQADARCAIHADRAAHGFTACAGYDCLGAGQRLTRAVGAAGWRGDPRPAAALFDGFLQLRGLHELLALLAAARGLVADAGHATALAALQAEVDAACDALVAAARVAGGVAASADAPLEAEGGGAPARGAAATLRARTHALLRTLATDPAIAARRPRA